MPRWEGWPPPILASGTTTVRYGGMRRNVAALEVVRKTRFDPHTLLKLGKVV